MTASLEYDPFENLTAKDVVARSLETFPFTDYGNAERLVQMHGDNMLYVPAWKKWIVWDGKRWRRDDDNQVERYAKDTVRSLYAVAASIEEEAHRTALAGHARKSENRARLSAMMDLARSELGLSVRPDQLDADPWVLNVQNGTLDLRTGELHEHDREQLLTKVLAVPYEANAKYPRWERFMAEVVPDQELRAFVQRAVGYSLTGLTVEEVMFILLGPGSNGKSKFLETLRLLFDAYGQSAPTALLMQKPFESIPADLARLPGARFVTVNESERGQRLAEGTIKSLTSGDRMAARGLYENPFDFNPSCKIWLATNHLPTIKGDDDGIWRRIIVLTFAERISAEKRDKHLLETLRKELVGILRWALQGCEQWRSDGFAPPASVVAQVESYRQQEDFFGQFLRDATEDAPDGWASTDGLFQSYERWCTENGVRFPITKVDLGRRLSERGYTPHRKSLPNGSKPRGFKGLSALPYQA